MLCSARKCSFHAPFAGEHPDAETCPERRPSADPARQDPPCRNPSTPLAPSIIRRRARAVSDSPTAHPCTPLAARCSTAGCAVRSYVLAAASSRVPRRGSSAPLAANSPASRPASCSAHRRQSQRPVQTSVGDAPSTCLLVRVTRARPDVSPSPGWPLCSFQSVSAASSRSPISAISFAYTVFATAQTFS